MELLVKLFRKKMGLPSAIARSLLFGRFLSDRKDQYAETPRAD
jgi:hypothetical protein